MAHPLINRLRPECLKTSPEWHSDYPVPLLTRRTLALQSANIMEARRNSPREVRYGSTPWPRRRPPC